MTFQERIYSISRQIPVGKVATYQQLATLAGHPKSARAVGMCMSRNQHPEIVPCHRVVSSSGQLTGYAFGGISAKKSKLIQEGVNFINDRVDLSHSQWHPDQTKII